MLKVEQLFVNLTIIDWLGSPYAGIMMGYCPYSGILTQHNVELVAEKGKDYARRKRTKAPIEGKK